MTLHPTIARVTERIIERSRDSRRRYLELMDAEGDKHRDRNQALPCSNLAHGFAAMEQDKASIAARTGPNLGVISAYNDTISSHQPFGQYPPQMKVWAREVGATCQVAGSTPSHIAGVLPATWQVAPTSRAQTFICGGYWPNGWWLEIVSL